MLTNLILTCFLLSVSFMLLCESAVRKNVAENKIKQYDKRRYDSNQTLNNERVSLSQTFESCWLSMNAKKHINAMAEIDEKYKEARERFRDSTDTVKTLFDESILEGIVQSRGTLGSQNKHDIPSGLNLGGYAMVRMPKSILFFHRLKLRNDTRFRINDFKTDLLNMHVNANFTLHDLHLIGSYERAITDEEDFSKLLYSPTYGEVEILLKNAKYTVEGRLRLLQDSLYITLMSSSLDFEDALMIYKNDATQFAKPVAMTRNNIVEFMDRLEADLNEWMKDYLNEALVFFTRVGAFVDDDIRAYQQKRTAELNSQVENSIQFLKNRLHQMNATAVKLPNFSIDSTNGVELALSDGVLRGLDTMYRRSAGTSSVEGSIHNVDAIVGFSNLKVVYRYTAYLMPELPPLNGLFVLTANELTATMRMALQEEPENVDLTFEFLHQLKSESLTVEGPASRMISNFKHLLEYHVVSIMSNALYHNIRQLSSLVKCQPRFYPHITPEETSPQEEN